MLKQKLIKFGIRIYLKHPILQPYLAFINRTFFKPKFSGWGMTTEAELPWDDEYGSDIFRRASEDFKKNFEFSKISAYPNNVDTLLWRHWIVSYAVRHAIEFAETNIYNFVECGVGDGFSAFFAMREILNHKKIAKQFSMHLYDSWSAMRKQGLLESELNYLGQYAVLDINRTKRNLSEFKDNAIYHQGYIPESFTALPKAPSSIIYLAIDLNSAKPTSDTLDFFFPRLVKGGIILFDDYGHIGYTDTKKITDKFFSDKPGILLKLPTGQAIYYH